MWDYITELRSEIAHLEARKHYHDATGDEQWLADIEQQLRNARGRLEAAEAR